MCKSQKQITNIQLPYAAKLLIQELLAMNIFARIKLEDSI